MRVLVITHLHPGRGVSHPAGPFEAFEREAAVLGARSLRLPYRCADPAAALAHLHSLAGTAVYLNTGVMARPLYDSVQSAVEALGGTMVVDADVNHRLMHAERWLPALEGLTAGSYVIATHDDLTPAVAAVGLPCFVKGSVISAKEHGWEACIAADHADLVARQAALVPGEVLIARQLLDLRPTGLHEGFRTSREYRVCVWQGRAIGCTYFWPGEDPWGPLSAEDRALAEDLAVRAAGRLGARLAAIDVAQLADASWTVIEPGDMQHTGCAHLPRAVLLNALTVV